MRNQKLTHVIAGRTIKEANSADDALHIEFTDGSTMKIKTGAPFEGSIAGKEVKDVRQKETEFDLDFADGSSSKITLAEETSSVMLRDKDGTLEYAD